MFLMPLGAVIMALSAHKGRRIIATMEPCKLAGETSAITSAIRNWEEESTQRSFTAYAKPITKNQSSRS